MIDDNLDLKPKFYISYQLNGLQIDVPIPIDKFDSFEKIEEENIQFLGCPRKNAC